MSDEPMYRKITGCPPPGGLQDEFVPPERRDQLEHAEITRLERTIDALTKTRDKHQARAEELAGRVRMLESGIREMDEMAAKTLIAFEAFLEHAQERAEKIEYDLRSWQTHAGRLLR